MDRGLLLIGLLILAFLLTFANLPVLVYDISFAAIIFIGFVVMYAEKRK